MTEKGFKEVKINRINPNNVSPIHVNDMLVSNDGKEFFFQFFEIEPPALLGIEDIEKLESIDAITKVKLVVSPSFVEAVIKALTDAIEKAKLASKQANE